MKNEETFGAGMEHAKFYSKVNAEKKKRNEKHTHKTHKTHNTHLMCPEREGEGRRGEGERYTAKNGQNA